MAHYLVTGAATGIGRAIKETLLTQSHQVSTLDIRDADFQCDLSDPALVIDPQRAGHTADLF